MEMYRTANPGMLSSRASIIEFTRPRPWPRRVASSTFLESNQSNGIVEGEGGFPLLKIHRQHFLIGYLKLSVKNTINKTKKIQG